MFIKNNRLKIAKAALVMLLATPVCIAYSFKTFVRAEHGRKAIVDRPRIVNIINFIRLLEPRDSAVTEDVLFQTVVKQVQLMKKYHLGGTFLLQYDALLDPRYQQLLKDLPRDSFEIGAWWEIPQPLVEKAGLKWRGRYPWDWRANIGFSTGYTPEERERLADVYMTDFKKIFGYFPKSVGCWFIDAHTLNYLYRKYGIVASCNCKDQYGTDGYTLWGGYWGQAYYPSKQNAYMPAQHEEEQIPVPIFRMLGSDPLRQYDDEPGQTRQGVITLEPVYPNAGGDSSWVNWYFNEFVTGASMDFAYTQAGQENSFTWNAMQKGLELQFPLIEKLRDQKKITVETLAKSGEWFKKKYRVTPATAVTINHDLANGDRKTVWFDSRFYRANLLWEGGTLRFRDIHLFDEKLVSLYETHKATSNECSFFTLPVVDGYLWGTPDTVAGLVFRAMKNGKAILLKGKDPIVDDSQQGTLKITWPLLSFDATMKMEFTEERVQIDVISKERVDWFLELASSGKAQLPFQHVIPKMIDAEFGGLKYAVGVERGSASKPSTGAALRITSQEGSVHLKL